MTVEQPQEAEKRKPLLPEEVAAVERNSPQPLYPGERQRRRRHHRGRRVHRHRPAASPSGGESCRNRSHRSSSPDSGKANVPPSQQSVDLGGFHEGSLGLRGGLFSGRRRLLASVASREDVIYEEDSQDVTDQDDDGEEVDDRQVHVDRRRRHQQPQHRRPHDSTKPQPPVVPPKPSRPNHTENISILRRAFLKRMRSELQTVKNETKHSFLC